MVAAAWGGAERRRPHPAGDRCRRRAERATSSASPSPCSEREHPLWIALNKVDMVKKPNLLTLSVALTERLNPDKVFMISAAQGDGVTDLKDALAAGDARRTVALPRRRGVRRHRPDDRRRADPRADLQPASPGAALRLGDRDRELGGPQGRLDRHPPADLRRARQPEGDRHRQGRIAAEDASATRRARKSPSTSAARCTCSCT